MNAPAPQPDTNTDPAAELARIAGHIARLEEVTRDWDEQYQSTLSAIKASIEELNREAFRRLIRFLREEPACATRLREAVRDPFVFGVLQFHGLIKEPLTLRVEQALEEVRPYLREHGGNVELVSIPAPDTIELRLVGACHGCPASSQTLSEGVERAIRRLCPEVQHIHQVSQPPSAASSGEQVVHFISPFARARDGGWEAVCTQEEIPDGGLLSRNHRGRDLLFYRKGSHVSCMDNACAHMGMPLDGGELVDGVLQCPYHGFRYVLETGECLTVPEVQLSMYPVKIIDGQVSVRLDAGLRK